MKQHDIEKLKDRIELQRLEILEFLDRLGHETRSLDVDSAQDSADRCVISLSKESLFEQSSERRTRLRLIEAAFRRIADGSFGVCVACGDDIQTRRLEALPWTQFCLRCQEAVEEEVGATLSDRAAAPTTVTWKRAG